MILSLSGRARSGKDLVAKIIQYLTSKSLPEKDMSFERYLDFYEVLYNSPAGIRMSIPEAHTPWRVKKFAYKLKQIATILTGVPVEKWEDQDFKKSYMPKEWNRLVQVSENEPDGNSVADGYSDEPMTVRTFLQLLGTEAIRNGLHTNAWVNALMSQYEPQTNWEQLQLYKGELKVGDVKSFPNWIISDMRFPNEFNSVKERGGICIRINRFTDETKGLHPSETALDQHKFDYVLSNHSDILHLIEEVRKMLEHFKLLP